jgi:hypothetical protein
MSNTVYVGNLNFDSTADSLMGLMQSLGIYGAISVDLKVRIPHLTRDTPPS